MKKALFLLLLVSLKSQAIIIVQDFSIQPSNNVTTATDIFASYDVFTSHFSSLSSPTTIATFNNQITIDVFIFESLLTVIGGVSENLFIGQLSEGNYNITANFYDTSSGIATLNTSLTKQVFVSAVPIPGAFWLFSSGLVFLTINNRSSKT
jgi:hypothetical protein